jgi:hypothetical protein
MVRSALSRARAETGSRCQPPSVWAIPETNATPSLVSLPLDSKVSIAMAVAARQWAYSASPRSW